MCRVKELAASRQSIEFGRFDRLHEDGRRLIQGWYDRAVADDQRAEPDFASFIYLWIAFNGWAACVTGEDTDRVWIDALIAEPDLNDRFDELMSEQSTATATAARQFAEPRERSALQRCP